MIYSKHYLFCTLCKPDHLIDCEQPGEKVGVCDTTLHGHVLVNLIEVHTAKGEYVGALPYAVHNIKLFFPREGGGSCFLLIS